MNRPDRILAEMTAALKHPPDLQHIIDARERLETLVPTLPDDVQLALMPMTEGLLDYYAEVAHETCVAGDREPMERPALIAYAVAMGLFVDGLIEYGRALQQAEGAGLAGLVNAVSVEGE